MKKVTPSKHSFSYDLQESDFDLSNEYKQLCIGNRGSENRAESIEERRARNRNAGAIVTFTGIVREFLADGRSIHHLELSTYPDLVDSQMMSLNQQLEQFDLDQVRIIHRYGKLLPDDQIVFVGIASAHRKQAFSAAEFSMNVLKSQVAFWKKEFYSASESDFKWIEPTEDDYESLKVKMD
jgi:molybdopterin synthase catalytic subunit